MTVTSDRLWTSTLRTFAAQRTDYRIESESSVLDFIRSVSVTSLSKRARQREVLYDMNRVVPRAALDATVPPDRKRGCPPLAIERMLRHHSMQHRLGFSHPAIEKAPHDVPPYRELGELENFTSLMPEESTIPRRRYQIYGKKNYRSPAMALPIKCT